MDKIDIDDLIGVQYRTDGRSIHTGFDCYGLAIEVEKRFGHILPDIKDSKAENDMESFYKINASIPEKMKEVSYPINPSDIVFMKDSRGMQIHIAVYLGGNIIVHCDCTGVHCEKISEADYRIGKVFSWQ